jgi:hypothetical protein
MDRIWRGDRRIVADCRHSAEFKNTEDILLADRYTVTYPAQKFRCKLYASYRLFALHMSTWTIVDPYDVNLKTHIELCELGALKRKALWNETPSPTTY